MNDEQKNVVNNEAPKPIGNEAEGINFPSTGADRKTEVEVYNTNESVNTIANSVNYSDTQGPKPEPVAIPKTSDVEFANSNQPQAKVSSLTDEVYSDSLDFPNSGIKPIQQKAPSPIIQGQTTSNFEFANDTLKKELNERQVTATPEENATMKKSFWQKVKDFFTGKNRKKGL